MLKRSAKTDKHLSENNLILVFNVKNLMKSATKRLNFKFCERLLQHYNSSSESFHLPFSFLTLKCFSDKSFQGLLVFQVSSVEDRLLPASIAQKQTFRYGNLL